MEQEFLDWYNRNQGRFHCGQFDERQIAYDAWLEGHRQSLTVEQIEEIVNVFSDDIVSKGQVIDELKLNFHKYKFN